MKKSLNTLIFILFLNSILHGQICEFGEILQSYKISDTEGGFLGTLADNDNFREIKKVGDIDGNGVCDVAVGSPYDDDGGLNRGAVWIIFLKTEVEVLGYQKISDISGNFTETLSDDNNFGYSLGTIGDMDGDGIPDLAVGSWSDDQSGVNSGAVWILFLNSNGTVRSSQKINMQNGGFTGVISTNCHFGISIDCIGDYDNDGKSDIVVGSSMQTNNSITNVGSIWILCMNSNGTVKSHYKISSGSGNFLGVLSANDRFGRAVANLGDLDSDGVNDLAVSSLFDDESGTDAGAVWILFLNSNGTVKSHQKICNATGGLTNELETLDGFGLTMSSGADLDLDGRMELAVSSYGDDDGGTNRGSVYLLFLNANGTVNHFVKYSSLSTDFSYSLEDNDGFGTGLSLFNELTPNGKAYLAVGAGGDDDGGTDRGAAYLMRLCSTSTGVQEESLVNATDVFPNPVNTELNIRFHQEVKGDIKVIISDMTGRSIIVSDTHLLTGQQNIRISTESLSPGIYTIQIINNQKMVMLQKIVK